MANKLKARLDAGKACVNAWLAIPSGFSAEMMAGCGWDSVTVDIQHGVQDYQSMVQCFQAMDKHSITPLVRVPWNEPGIIGKVLDGGAWGVICPMINNAAEAKALADACLYPPMGKRSNGPIRAASYGEASPYQTIANSEILIIPMIETQAGIDNIDEILSVPGISGIYIGPSDMGLALGMIPILDREEPVILDIYKKQCESNGKSIKRSQLSKMMDEETWLTAQEALNYGFINEIKKDARIKNAISMHDLQRRGYINMPIEKLQLLSISKQSKKMKLKEFKDVMIHAIKEGLQGIVQPNTSHVELKAQEIQEALEVKFNDAIQSQEQAIAALRNELTEKDNEIARLQGKSSITAPVSDPNAPAALNAKEQIEEKLAKEFGFHQLKAYRNIQLQKNN